MTTRTALASIAVLAVVLALAVPAVEVALDQGLHSHTWIGHAAGGPGLGGSDNVASPFWPRYWRRLLGRPHRAQPLCTPAPDREFELCEFAHPEIKGRLGPGGSSLHFTPAQFARLEVLRSAKVSGR